MRILSDCPDDLEAFVGPGGTWDRPAVSDLDASDRALWEALAVGSPASPRERASSLWTLDFDGARPAGFWHRALLLAEANGSRFDALHAALRGGLGLPGPVAVVALSGTGFRGQRDRRWATGPGNLFMSVGLAPDAPIERIVPGLTMLPAVATVEAIQGLPDCGLRPDIKWVNDILLDGRKVAGVLTATQVRGDRIESAVLGIGVNVASAPPIEATPFVPRAGCLSDCGVRIDRGEFLWRLLERLALRYSVLVEQGAQELLAGYREAAIVLGRRVRIWKEGVEKLGEPSAWPDPGAVGVVDAIGPDLALHLEGRAEPVRSGRLALDSVCAEFGL